LTAKSLAACVSDQDMTKIVQTLTHVTAVRWSKELSYLRIFIVSSRVFRCSLDYAKRSFHRAANAIFGERKWTHSFRGCSVTVATLARSRSLSIA